MDATRLPPPAAAPRTDDAAATVMGGGPQSVGGRYLLSPAARETPTGLEGEAHDTQGSAATGPSVVTLKLVPQAVLPTAVMADRALREWKQLAKVSSDRVARVLDQGRLDDGRLFLVTERTPARTLEDMLRSDGALALDRACAVALAVGEALAEAQKVGVIHRDVSPRNILVGDNGAVKVTDFGLAEPVNDKVFGTPAYLSPEQVEGKPVDQRSNIYSLAAVLYHAATGTPPFEGTREQLLEQALSATPAAPSTRRPGLPVELDRIVAKAMEKSGGRRHLTLRQLLTEIETLAKSPAVAAAAAKAPAAPTGRPAAATVMGIASPFAGAPPAGPSVPSTPQARTVMAEAPKLPPSPAGQPMPATVQAKTVMAETVRPPTPSPAPAQPAAEAAQARTVMAEAPRPAPAPAPAPTVMAEAPRPAPAPVASAPTMMAEGPAASAQPAQKERPPEVQAAVAQAAAARAAAAAKEAASGQKGFRETAWFKAGEIEEELSKKQAEASAASGGDPLASAGTTGQHAQVDPDRVEVSAADHARLSLKTGATQSMPVLKGVSGKSPALPGEQMDEKEMLAEIDSSKKWFVVAGVVLGVIVIAAVLFFALRGGSSAPPAKTEAPAPTPPAAVAGAPPAAAAPAPTPAPPAPTPEPPAPTPTPSKTTAAAPGGAALAAAQASVSSGDLAAAVTAFEEARSAGANAKDLKKVQAPLEKALAKKAAVAKKKKDRAGESEAKSLLARVKGKKR